MHKCKPELVTFKINTIGVEQLCEGQTHFSLSLHRYLFPSISVDRISVSINSEVPYFYFLSFICTMKNLRQCQIIIPASGFSNLVCWTDRPEL